MSEVIEMARPSAAGIPANSVTESARDSLKDTIESIVVALILAFVFRAFIVEAFVIPTGSMAPTLFGAHGTITCQDCGWEFTYGLKDLADHRAMQPILARSAAICPNCSHANTNLKINDDARNPESGDRILVLKWPFDIGVPKLGPARWDVTVFKNPADGVQNYIKRLIGLPNEVLMIVSGDVYTVSTSELSEETLAELEVRRAEKYQLRTQARRGRLRPVSQRVLEELDEKLTIARKGRVAQEALWFVVYDHDYPPRSLDRNQPRWEPRAGKDSGWDTSRRHVRFEPATDPPDYIELRGKPIRADYAYNVARPGVPKHRPPPVSDQRVRFVWTPISDGAAIQARLVKADRSFWATVRTDGTVRILESHHLLDGTARAMLQKQLSPIPIGESIEISFENVDYRLALSVGGKKVLATSLDRDHPSYYGPNIEAQRRSTETLSSPPRIYGSDGAFELSHLVVERDVYYFRTKDAVDWCDQGGWGTVGNPILLREGEYFMLGDNSPASQDSRLWGDVSRNRHLADRGEAFQLGTVPADQLIGKAFFVYWPSAHRMKWMPIPRHWGVIPNVGRMRWIR